MSQSGYESYPPLFRQKESFSNEVDSNFVGDDDEPPKHTLDSDPLPVIDLQGITSHDFDQKQLISDACTDWGIFRLVNHGIPTTLLNQLQEQAKQVFDLGFQSKQDLFNGSPVSYFWGTPALSAAGVALQRGPPQAQKFNWVEGLNVPLSQVPQLQTEDPLLHSFRSLLEEYGKHQSRVARTMFEVMADNLQLCSNQQSESSYLSTSTGLLRVYRYPAASCCSMGSNQEWGIDVHTDSSVISILNQDEVGGLQVCKDNTWLDVKPVSNTLIVHIGDMMQAMSNDRYVSVKHRVKVNKHKERISVGYFVFPAEDCVIHSSRYKPFTYADFRAQVQQDLKSHGFKVGLQRFTLDEIC